MGIACVHLQLTRAYGGLSRGEWSKGGRRKRYEWELFRGKLPGEEGEGGESGCKEEDTTSKVGETKRRMDMYLCLYVSTCTCVYVNACVYLCMYLYKKNITK